MSKLSTKLISAIYSIEKIVPAIHRNIVLSVLFILVLSFRWNYQDPKILETIVEKPQIEANNHDIHNYQLLVKYFRGDAIESTIKSPFRYRIFTPLIASLIPLSPLISLNVVNLIFHLISLLILYQILKLLKFSSFEQSFGLFLYICSYPMLMYGAVGWNEPVSIGFIIIGIYYLIKGKRNIVLLIIALGSLNNEKILILILFVLAYEWKHRRFNAVIIGIFIFIVIQVIVRYWSNRLVMNNTNIESLPIGYVWFPSINHIYNNLILRWSNYPSALLTFGLSGIGAAIFIRQKLNVIYKEYYPFVFGFFASLLLYIYSVTVAVASGRLLWYIYPFSIVLSVKMLQHFHNAKENTMKIIEKPD